MSILSTDERILAYLSLLYHLISSHTFTFFHYFSSIKHARIEKLTSKLHSIQFTKYITIFFVIFVNKQYTRIFTIMNLRSQNNSTMSFVFIQTSNDSLCPCAYFCSMIEVNSFIEIIIRRSSLIYRHHRIFSHPLSIVRRTKINTHALFFCQKSTENYALLHNR